MYIIPFILIFFVPLIVFEKALILDGDLKYFWLSPVNFDYFSYYKGKVLLILISFSLMSLLYRLRNEDLKIKKSKIYIPMIIYSIFVILSTIFSKYKKVAFLGYPDRYEGTLILLGYMLLVFLFMNVPKKKDIKFLIGAFLVSSTILGIISIFQFFDYDFIKNYITNRLVSFQIQYVGKVVINFKPDYRNVYLTLYHSNYVGSYMAMAFIISFILYASNDNKKRFIYGAISILMFFSLISSHSRAGLLGVIFSMFVFIFVKYRDIIKNLKYIIPICIIYTFTFIFIDISSGEYIGNKLGSLFVDINQTVSKQNFDTGLMDIKPSKDKLSFVFSDYSLNFVFENNKLKIVDNKNHTLPFKLDESTGQITFKEEKYNNLIYSLKYYKNNPVIIADNKFNSINLVKYDDGFKILSNNNKLLDIKDIKKVDFHGKEKLGSSRVYIWSRSIPLIKNTIFVGYGPDVYALYYPQEDFIGKFCHLYTPFILVDKPHNMYLQNAINIGLIGLLSFIAIFVIYLLKDKRFLKPSININKENIIFISIYFAVIAYLVAGVFNDSVVSVAPVFWALLGIGLNENEN